MLTTSSWVIREVKVIFSASCVSPNLDTSEDSVLISSSFSSCPSTMSFLEEKVLCNVSCAVSRSWKAFSKLVIEVAVASDKAACAEARDVENIFKSLVLAYVLSAYRTLTAPCGVVGSTTSQIETPSFSPLFDPEPSSTNILLSDSNPSWESTSPVLESSCLDTFKRPPA